MKFANIEQLYIILPLAAVIIALLLFYAFWRRYAVRMIFRVKTADRLIHKGRRILISEIIILVSVLLFVLVLLGPQWGDTLRESHSEGSDIIVMLDVSRSMMADDIKPYRLERAKQSIRLLAESLQGDRIALIVFAGDSFLLCPLTNDIAAFEMFLDSADVNSVRVQGTDIGKALESALKTFNKKNIAKRLALIITDGDDHEGAVDNAIDELKSNDVTVWCAGIGRESAVYLQTEDGSLMKDVHGDKIKSGQNRSLLEELASSTGGEYFSINDSLSGIKKIAYFVGKGGKNDFGTRFIRTPIDRYQIPAVILAILLLSESALWGFRRR